MEIYLFEDTVIDFVSTLGADSDAGCTVEQVIAATCISAGLVRDIIHRLEGEGYIYSTIDEQHYELTLDSTGYRRLLS